MNAQLDRVVAGFRSALADALVGVYLHGSLVLGCFNANRSDVDLLVVTARRMKRAEREAVAELCLRESGSYERPGWPRPLELSILTREQLHPWRYPTPFDFHFAESHRPILERGEVAEGEQLVDHDLAAHVTVLRARRRPLYGPPVEEVFPAVPREHHADSLRRDFVWARDRGNAAPRYALLSMGRVWATLATGEIHSKDSGTAWAAERVPHELRPLLERALASYRGDGGDFEVDPDALGALTRYLAARVSAR